MYNVPMALSVAIEISKRSCTEMVHNEYILFYLKGAKIVWKSTEKYRNDTLEPFKTKKMVLTVPDNR